MAAVAQAFGQRLVGGALDRLLARGIDGRHDHRIGIVEAAAELVEQMRQAAYSGAAA